MIKIIFMYSLLTITCVRSESLPQKKEILVYQTGIREATDLPICPKNYACNIVYKRFWLPTLVERICMCPNFQLCDRKWSENPDNYTMTLDNRSQIKFCAEIDLPKCTEKDSALRVIVQSPHENSNLTAVSKGDQYLKKSKRYSLQKKSLTAFCNCPEPHYWRLKVNSTKYEKATDKLKQTYFCSELKKCKASEFCGYVRKDTYSTYYRCSCPMGHLCISQDKTVYKIEELLFNGEGYKAFCLPVEN